MAEVDERKAARDRLDEVHPVRVVAPPRWKQELAGTQTAAAEPPEEGE